MSGIVVGIDGSHNSSRALEWAMSEAALRSANLTVITVNSVPASYWSGQPVTLGSGDAERVEEMRKLAQDAVDKVEVTLGDAQPESVSVVAISGFPAQTLIEASKDADLMVIGSRGGGGFGSLILGSIASQVVHHSHSPVVVVPTGR